MIDGVPFEQFYAEPSRNGVYKPAQFRGTGVPMVNMGELFANEFIGAQDMERIQLSEAELGRSELQDGDLLFGRRSVVEAGAGKCALVVEPPESLTFESSIIRVRLSRAKANPRFFHYYFASPHGRGLVRTIVSGAAVKGIRGSDLAKLAVTVPDVRVQTRIADILSAYDVLIENNRRRMALLEDAARQLYREWFVRLHFPGHEHTHITDGVPEGWEAKRIGDVADCVGGGTPSTRVPRYWDDGDIVWVTPTDVTRNVHFVLLDSEKKITESGLEGSSAKLVPPHTILMTSRASVGYFAVVDKEVCTNQGFISIVPHEAESWPYFLFHLCDRVEEIRSMGSGSTYPEVSRGKFREFSVLVPNQALVVDFCATVSTYLRQIQTLKRQNQHLRNARDLLLPRLMSGEISV